MSNTRKYFGNPILPNPNFTTLMNDIPIETIKIELEEDGFNGESKF